MSGEYWESVEIPIMRKDGDIRIALWNSANIYDKNGKTHLTTIAQGHDITERKRAEEALQHERDILQTLFDNHPDFIFFKDVEARYYRPNKSICEFLGRNMEDIIGRTDLDLFPEEISRQMYTEDLHVIKTGTPSINKEEIVGTVFLTSKMPWFDSEGNKIGLFGISRDITERKQAEEALRESEERYRSLYESMSEGMVIQELLARQRIRRILVVCPASLQRQWAEEMLSKFALRFEIVDRTYAQRLRREYGAHINPWASYPRLITSMDFLKREAPLQNFLASLQPERTGGLRDWDLLVVDEAHNVAPSGRGSWVRDSDRTIMMRQILGHFEHRLFLTATPHNGFTESFTALLEMLDPLRFTRSPVLNREHLRTVMVRRLKDDIVDALGQRKFAPREVRALKDLQLCEDETEMLRLLDEYRDLRMARAHGQDLLPVKFALTLLKKRLLSSPKAFNHSINVHHTHLAPTEEPGEDTVQVVARLKQKLGEDFSDDEEKDRTEETAQAEASSFFRVTDQERQLVERLRELAGVAAERPDTKLHALVAWIKSHLQDDQGGWNSERLLIFTEYKDTLHYLVTSLKRRGWGDQVLFLHGGAGVDREQIKAAFRKPPDEDPVRVLVATDAASEGLNLQDHCRYLLHWEIPWNPNKMEQRNGRIDRHGQRADKVFCYHFTYQGWEDQQFLDVVVDKVRTQRHDLGSVGDVIAAQVEEALRGERRHIVDNEDLRRRMHDEVEAEVVTRARIRELESELQQARHTWDLFPETLQQVLHEALLLVGHRGLKTVDGGDLAGRAWVLEALPPTWAECRLFITDVKGRLLRLVFDEKYTRDRRDVTLIHLDHPLMKRALAVFRANLWSVGLHESHQLSRVSYRVVPRRDLSRPVVMLVARLVAIGRTGSKLHEELLLVGGPFQEEVIHLDQEGQELERLLAIKGEHPPLPGKVAALLRRFFPAHERVLQQGLEQRAGERDQDIRLRLKQRGTDEAAQVRKLVAERLREVDRRVKEMEKERESPQMLLPGMEDQSDQHSRTLGWLRGRQDQLQRDRQEEPKAIRERYVLRDSPRAFPLALLYLLPDSLLKGGG